MMQLIFVESSLTQMFCKVSLDEKGVERVKKGCGSALAKETPMTAVTSTHQYVSPLKKPTPVKGIMTLKG